MNGSRIRLYALAFATMCLLALATVAESRDLAVVPAAQATEAAAPTGIGPASQWCEQRRPHTGDTVVHASWLDIDPGVVTARCAAVHPGASHFYYVTIWADGLVQWTPLGPWWT